MADPSAEHGSVLHSDPQTSKGKRMTDMTSLFFQFDRKFRDLDIIDEDPRTYATIEAEYGTKVADAYLEWCSDDERHLWETNYDDRTEGPFTVDPYGDIFLPAGAPNLRLLISEV